MALAEPAQTIMAFVPRIFPTNAPPVAGTDAMVWTLVEPGVAIVASSLATIRPLLRALRIRGFESTGRAAATRSGTNRSFALAAYPKRDPEAQAIRSTMAEAPSTTPEPEPETPTEERSRRAQTKSEVFVIEGSRLQEPWANSTIASPSGSSVHVDATEAISQHDGKVGLGGTKGAYEGYAR
jgi:hypothetical protein